MIYWFITIIFYTYYIGICVKNQILINEIYSFRVKMYRNVYNHTKRPKAFKTYRKLCIPLLMCITKHTLSTTIP